MNVNGQSSVLAQQSAPVKDWAHSGRAGQSVDATMSSLGRCPSRAPLTSSLLMPPTFFNFHHSHPIPQPYPRLPTLKCSAWSFYSVLWSLIYCCWVNVLISLTLGIQSQVYVCFWQWTYNLHSDSHLLWVNLDPFLFMANERARKQKKNDVDSDESRNGESARKI